MHKIGKPVVVNTGVGTALEKSVGKDFEERRCPPKPSSSQADKKESRKSVEDANGDALKSAAEILINRSSERGGIKRDGM